MTLFRTLQSSKFTCFLTKPLLKLDTPEHTHTHTPITPPNIAPFSSLALTPPPKKKQGFYDFFVPWFNGQGGFTMAADGVTYTLDPVLCEESFDTDAVTKVQACVPRSKETSVSRSFKVCVCVCVCDVQKLMVLVVCG